MISWTEIKNEHDPRGTYTHQIKWNPPASSGFIVQYVDVEDPCNILSGYTLPYYEAWRVDEGKVVNEVPGPNDYDDSFSNCWDGEWPATEIAIETAERQMKKAGTNDCFIAYHCVIFWIPANTADYEEVNMWNTGEDAGIRMAGKLKASYVAPKNLTRGQRREFRADFRLDAEKQAK